STIKENNEEQEVNEKITTLLDQQEKEAFIHKLHTIICYKTRICLSKINHEATFKIFNNLQKLSKSEYNMLLLGILHIITRPTETLCDKEKQYLTVKYTFDTNKICEKAFQTIYSLSNKKCDNIHQHYHTNSIKPIKHVLIRKKPFSALLFTTVLNILTFIINYTNCYRLPSSGQHFQEDTMAIIFLSASKSYAVLHYIYQSNLDENSDYYVSHWSFMWIWKKYVSEIHFLSPRSNLCMLCKNM
ncbi:9067_t:CDS:2, partial [Cetraspora pellucida]